MNVTEAEAKTKWCHRRLSLPPLEGSQCIGCACMAWRWQPLMADDAFLAAVKRATEEHPGQGKAAAHVTANRAAYGLPDKPFRGYCGLAGEPRP